MTDLLDALSADFPPECLILNKSSISANRCSFGITKQADDEIIKFDFDELVKCLPGIQRENELIADALFICRSPGLNHFLIVIVELKGADVLHGRDQITETCQRFCKGGRCASLFHSREIARWSVGRHPYVPAGILSPPRHHMASVLGILVSTRGFQQSLRKRSFIRKNQNMKILTKQVKYNPSLAELFRVAGFS